MVDVITTLRLLCNECVTKAMTDYDKEMNYRLDLMYALGGQQEAEQLAEQLLEYGELEARGVLTDSQNRLDMMRYLAFGIESDSWRLQRFREVYVFSLLSLPDSVRPRVAEAIRVLCEAHFPFLKKSLGFQLREIKELLTRLGGVASVRSQSDIAPTRLAPRPTVRRTG